jgi:hypothetical protein
MRHPRFLSEIPNKADWIMPIVVFILSMTIMGFSGYFNNDKALAERITAVEAHQGDTEKRLDRIETKVDTLGSKLDTVFYYVTGIKVAP